VNGLPISRLNIMKAKPFFQGGPHPNWETAFDVEMVGYLPNHWCNVKFSVYITFKMVKNHLYQCHPIQQCRLQHQCQFVTFVFSLLELCTSIFVSRLNCLLPAASSLDETCSKRGQASVQASKQEHLALVYNFTRQQHTVNLRTARYIQTVKSDPAFRRTDQGDHRSQKS
jgi:hypothetical protein